MVHDACGLLSRHRFRRPPEAGLPYVAEKEAFCFIYGDGIADVNIPESIEFTADMESWSRSLQRKLRGNSVGSKSTAARMCAPSWETPWRPQASKQRLLCAVSEGVRVYRVRRHHVGAQAAGTACVRLSALAADHAHLAKLSTDGGRQVEHHFTAAAVISPYLRAFSAVLE